LFVAFIDGSAEKLNGGMHSEQRATWSTPNPGGNESGDGEGFHCMMHEHTQQPRGLRWHAPGGGRAAAGRGPRAAATTAATGRGRPAAATTRGGGASTSCGGSGLVALLQQNEWMMRWGGASKRQLQGHECIAVHTGIWQQEPENPPGSLRP
jgi:hypothetical protein